MSSKFLRKLDYKIKQNELEISGIISGYKKLTETGYLIDITHPHQNNPTCIFVNYEYNKNSIKLTFGKSNDLIKDNLYSDENKSVEFDYLNLDKAVDYTIDYFKIILNKYYEPERSFNFKFNLPLSAWYEDDFNYNNIAILEFGKEDVECHLSRVDNQIVLDYYNSNNYLATEKYKEILDAESEIMEFMQNSLINFVESKKIDELDNKYSIDITGKCLTDSKLEI